MKHGINKIWAAICTIWVSTASTLTAYATEQGTEKAEEVSGFLLTMDVLQKVCLGIVVAVAILVLGFYIVKLVLKKMHVPPEGKSEDEHKTE